MGISVGLDIGTTSAAIAVLENDINGNPIKILFLDSLIFPRAEVPKTGASLALPRREKRGTRRINRRRKERKYRTKRLFINNNLLTNQEIVDILNSKDLIDIYQLRVEALDRKISNVELFRLLYFFVGHRGFKSNRKFETKEKENSIILASIKKFKEEITDKGYRTFGELLFNDERYKERKTNKAFNNGYLGTAARELIIDEVRSIFSRQIEFGNDAITDELIDSYVGLEEKSSVKYPLLTAQRNFDEGPGEGSPFGGNQIENKVGLDTLDPDERRAPKATYTFQYFDLLSKLNNLKVLNENDRSIVEMPKEQREEIISFAMSHKKTNYAQLRKILNMNDGQIFNLLTYSSKKDKKEVEKAKFFEPKPVFEIQDCLPESLKKNTELIDEIGSILTLTSSNSSRTKEFENRLNIEQEIVDKLLYLNYSGFSHLSIKTMRKIIPFLELGLVYSDATVQAGYDFKMQKIDLDYIRENVTNPVVYRSVMKSIRFLKHVLKKYGKPDIINIELARDLGKSAKERRDIEDSQKENMARNEKVKNRLVDLNIPVNGENILRLKLYDEQKGVDLYSGENILLDELFSSRYEVDHIIPYSTSFDDSYSNKTLTSAKSNREKGNRIPRQYFGIDSDRDHKFQVLVKNNIYSKSKKTKLLKKALSEEEKNVWKSRSLNDTRYINRLLAQYLEQNIEFSDNHPEKKRKVNRINGAVTAKIRSRWGINKVREDGDLHHAVDATVLATITPAMVKRVTNYSKNQEIKYNKDLWTKEISDETKDVERLTKGKFDTIFNDFPLPWPDFRDELIFRVSSTPSELMKNRTWAHYTKGEIASLKQPFVIRRPMLKTKGPAHADTIIGVNNKLPGQTVKRVPVNSFKLTKGGKLNKMLAGSVTGGSNLVEQAIIDELHKPEKERFEDGKLVIQNGDNEMVVRKVKIIEKSSSVVSLGEKSAAANGSMVRIDVFKNEKGKFVFIPVYVADTVKKELPDKYVSLGKNGWIKLTENEQFLFSLYRNDVLHIKSSKGIKVKYSSENSTINKPNKVYDVYGYFNMADIATASIRFVSPDNSYFAKSVGIASLDILEKMQVDYLGQVHRVKHEDRKGFNRNR